MTEISAKSFKKIAAVRKLLNSVSLSDAKKIAEKFITVVDELEQDEKLREVEEQRKSKRIDELLLKLEGEGISVDSLVKASQEKKTHKPKYRINKDGENIEWSGYGRRPKAFVGIENLENYLISAAVE